MIELTRIPDDEYEPEESLYRRFHNALPEILGAIFNTLSKALNLYDSTDSFPHTRMQDFAKYGYCIAEALGGYGDQSIQVYQSNKQRSKQESRLPLVVECILSFMLYQSDWSGSMTLLYEHLSKIAKGYHIVDWYCDRAISGKTANHRPEFLKMFEDLKKGDAKAVLIHKLDRFSRSQADYAIYTRQLELMEVELVSVMERLDDSPSGKLLQSVISSINEFYVNNLSHEVMKGLKLNASKAIFNGGIPPLGYKIVNQHYEIEPEEAQAVHLIFSLYDQGYHYGQIQHQLNALGYKTKAGKPFGKNSLYEILRRECYIGTYVYNRTQKRRADGSRSGRPKPDSEVIRVPDAIPAIIEQAMWERVQKRMDENRGKGGRQKAKELYLLSGLVYCGLCGHSYVGNARYPGKDRQKFVSYCCSHRHNTLSCTNREIKRDVLEGYVLEIIQKHILNETVIPQLTEELNKYLIKTNIGNTEDKKQYQTRLEELEREKTNIIDAIARTGLCDVFSNRLNQIEPFPKK